MERFNERGYVHIRLQHIAEAAEMSVGNMAYHFPHKPDILHALYGQLRQEQEARLGEIGLTPVFGNFDYFLRQSFLLQLKYRFFYQDTLELMRESETLRVEHLQLIEFQHLQLEVLLAYNQARGALEWDTSALPLCRLARQLRRAMDSWFYLQQVEGRQPGDEGAFCSNAWRVLYPWFTEAGLQEYSALKKATQVVF